MVEEYLLRTARTEKATPDKPISTLVVCDFHYTALYHIAWNPPTGHSMSFSANGSSSDATQHSSDVTHRSSDVTYHSSDVTHHSSDVTCEVLVIGAGVSGLTAAHELLKRDPSVRLCVVEAKGQFVRSNEQ